MSLPVDYTMCCQTVTVYRKAGDGIARREIPDCYFQWQDEEIFDLPGRRTERKFLLVQPGDEQLVFVGDRVLEGIGPDVAVADWHKFLPDLVSGLAQVTYAKPYYWQGTFCHTEAGRK